MSQAPADPSSASPQPRKRRLRKWAIRLLLLGLLAAIGGELFARYYIGLGDPPLSQTDPQLEYLFKPDQDCRRFGKVSKYNHYSMRSDDFPLHKSGSNELRVIVVGDSVVNGGVLCDQSEIATSILQKKLTEDLHRPVIVGNISAGSWGPPNELAYLQRYGLFDADVVVIVLSSHDYADVPTFEPLVGVNPNFPDHKPVSALWEGFVRYFLPRLHRQSVSEEAFVPAAAKPSQNDVDWCLKSLHEMIEMARDSGARVIVAQHLERDETMSSLLAGHAEIKAECRRDGIAPIQLGPAFAEARTRGELPYRDAIHPNTVGQRIIATTLLGPIENSLKTPSTKLSTRAVVP